MFRIKGRRTIIGLEGALVASRSIRWRAGIGRHAVDIRCRSGRPGEHGCTCHPIIAVRVIPRNKSLVAPEPMHSIPWQAVAKRVFGEQLVEPTRGRAAREAYRKATPNFHGELCYPTGDP